VEAKYVDMPCYSASAGANFHIQLGGFRTVGGWLSWRRVWRDMLNGGQLKCGGLKGNAQF